MTSFLARAGFALAFVFASTLAPAVAQEPRATLECKRRHPLVYRSYLWVTIEPVGNAGDLLFRYGNGIDTQMLEVFFETLVTEVAPGKYATKNEDFSLEAGVKNGRLDFEIRTASDRLRKKKFACQTKS